MTSAFFDGARYWLGVVYLASVPGAVLFWFAIHPFAAFWRRAGAVAAYAAGFSVMAAAAAVAVAWRRPLMGADLGPNVTTAALGIVLIVVSAVVRHRWRRQLTMRILFGLPEIAPSRFPPTLLTEGIYATVRHPRYAEFSLGAVGWAFLCNYAGIYAAAALTLASIGALIPFEERELAARFGAPYAEYRRRVPAVIPRLRR
jgi:protein-S-isoprenylcysteine O-methyltransferase Ste14